MTTVLTTPRLHLRQWQPDDWLLLRPIVTDPRMLRFIGHGEPWSDERIQRFVNGGMEAAKSRGWILWPVIHSADDRFIGFCGFNNGYPPTSKSAVGSRRNTGGKGWRPKPRGP